MAANQNEKVYKFVRGICKYISHLFETGTAAEEELVPSEPLRIFFNHCISHHRRHLESRSYECVFREDRIPILETMLKTRLKEAAQTLLPLDFLIKCKTFIVVGSFLKQHGFIEAPDITCNAVYEAYVDSQQHHYIDQWLYVEISQPPIICTISNEMGVRVLHRVNKFVHGICKYISSVYETGTVPVYDETEYSPSESLRILFDRCINDHNNHLNMHAYDFASQDNPIDILQDKWISSLKNAAETSDHFDFLIVCVSYIIAGSCLKQRGFLEAPDIANAAIYHTFLHSEQYKYLKPWFYIGGNFNPNW